MTILLYRFFETISFLTTLPKLLESTGTATAFNFSTFILSTSSFRIAKSDFAVNLDVSTPITTQI